MGILIGVDEAGLGPNLGPFVGTATVWKVPGLPGDFDLFQEFSTVLTNTPLAKDSRWHVADSKAVYQPGMIASLERSVRALLTLSGLPATTHRELCAGLAANCVSVNWLADCEEALPCATSIDDADRLALWKECLTKRGIELSGVFSTIVWPKQWNELIARSQNKSVTVTELLFQLIRTVWEPVRTEDVLVISDKHGGRARYGPLIASLICDELPQVLEETAVSSRYRVGKTEFRFQPRAESHLPVAYASMVCKYVREVSMRQFNRFWAAHLPGLKPTQGYPVDAKRFAAAIEAKRIELGIPWNEVWRCR